MTTTLDGQVAIMVCDLLGRRIKVLAHGFFTAGNHSLNWEASNLASGTYLLLLESPSSFASYKILLVR